MCVCVGMCLDSWKRYLLSLHNQIMGIWTVLYTSTSRIRPWLWPCQRQLFKLVTGEIRAHLLWVTQFSKCLINNIRVHMYLSMPNIQLYLYIYIMNLHYWGLTCDSPDWTWHGMSFCPSSRTRCRCPRDADADGVQLWLYPRCLIFGACCDTCAYHAWPDYNHVSDRIPWWPARWTRRWIPPNWIRPPRPRLSIRQRDLLNIHIYLYYIYIYFEQISSTLSLVYIFN